MNIVDKIFRGDEFRKSRLHDEQGNLVAAEGLSNFPKAAWTYVALKLADRRPVLPWISYNAIEKL